MSVHTLWYMFIVCCCAYSIFFGYYFSFKVFSYIQALSVVDQALVFSMRTAQLSLHKDHSKRYREPLKNVSTVKHQERTYSVGNSIAILHGLKKKKQLCTAIASYNLCNDD